MDSITGGALAQIDKARQFLDTFNGSIPEVQEIHGRAAAYIEFFRHCQTGLAAQNLAAELKIRCERKLGELLGDPPPRGRPGKNRQRCRITDDCGIESHTATRLRKVAAVPEGELVAYFHACNEDGLEITSAGVLRLWRALNRKPKDDEEVPAEVKPEPADVDEEVRPEFWKSAATCRDEVRRCARKLKDVKTVLSGLVESPYKPLLSKAAHGDKSVALTWDGTETQRAGALGAVLVEKVYTCPAVESLTALVAGLEVLMDREVTK